MNEERRQHGRLAKAFEGSWKGASGATRCRIADVSLGGCFVQSLAMPKPGESTDVTVTTGDRTLTITGTVAYVETGMGFAVKFSDLSDEQRTQLAALISAPAQEQTGESQ